METTNIVDFSCRNGMTDALTVLLRTGAQQLIATAVDAEFAVYLGQFSDFILRQVTQPWSAMGIIQPAHSKRVLGL